MGKGRLALMLCLGAVACGEGLLLTDPNRPDDGGTPSTPLGANDGQTTTNEAASPMEMEASASGADASCAQGDQASFAYNTYRDGGACRPLACLPTGACPATWTETIADKFAFCAKYSVWFDFDAFRSTESCRGWLVYEQSHFDGGPTYCLYDPVTEGLAAYAAFDGKGGYAERTCGFASSDFNFDGCSGRTCAQPETPDGGVCPPGVQRCSDGGSQTCDATGQWDGGTTCPYACIGGACTGECVPAAKDCVGSVPRTCDETGHWTELGACTRACSAGACGGVCDGTCACVGGICP